MERRLADRRGRPRFEVVGELWGTVDAAIGMPLLNVGNGGALVHSSVPLALQSVHQVTIDGDGQLTAASVQVRHVRSVVGDDGHRYYLIGVEFLGMPAALRAQIEAWTGGGAHGLETV